jgi:uncharacterized protein YjbI with pentapeptide repeats
MDRKDVEGMIAKAKALPIPKALLVKAEFFPGINLHGADLRGADLSGLDLRGANLHGADLTGANVRGTNFTRANLHGATLKDAVDDKDTKLDKANLHAADIKLKNGKASMKDANLHLAKGKP